MNTTKSTFLRVKAASCTNMSSMATAAVWIGREEVIEGVGGS